jgi:hypothetical protein
VAKTKLSPWGFIGMGAMVSVLFLVLATAVVAPWWVTTLMVLMWLVLFVVATQWFAPRPTRVPWLAAVAFVVWLTVISLGVRLLGWS